jgi:ferredoxin
MERHRINRERCLICGGCVSVCPEDAIELRKDYAFVIEERCRNCSICVNVCPVGAVRI